MRLTIKKSTTIYLFLLAILCLLPAMNWAAVAVKTEVVSGKIVKNNADHSVWLDNGNIYHPRREGLAINLKVGEPVTLRYVTEPGNKNVFFEFAPGLNSLKEIPLPPPRK